MKLSSVCFFAILFVGLTFLPAQATDASASGIKAEPKSVPTIPSRLPLIARRVVSDFQKKQLPELSKKLQEAAGFDVPITIDWESICEDGYSHLWSEAWTKQYFLPVTEALKEITKDEMGRSALKEKLVRIHFCNSNNNHIKKRAVSFKDGVLKYDHRPCSNIPSFSDGKGDCNFNDAIKALTDIFLNAL